MEQQPQSFELFSTPVVLGGFVNALTADPDSTTGLQPPPLILVNIGHRTFAEAAEKGFAFPIEELETFSAVIVDPGLARKWAKDLLDAASRLEGMMREYRAKHG